MNKNLNHLHGIGKLLVVGSIVGASLAGCGGKSSGAASTGNTPTAAVSITGTAAAGAPIIGKVVAIDSSTPRQTFSATTSAAGAYTVNVAGGTAPFMLTVLGTSGGKVVSLNSVATAIGQTVNITPLTDLIVSTAAGQPGGAALANLCTSTVAADQTACKTALTAATTGTNLSAAVTAVTNMIAPLNGSNINPLNGALVGGSGTGMDAVLDKILVTPAPSLGAMATVTLIAVPTQQLGTVTMPATAGGATITAIVTPPATAITAATTAATALSEIQACMASFNALYATGTSPTTTQLTPFIDATFSMGVSSSQTAFVQMLSTLVGLSFTPVALSNFDITPQATAPGAWNLPPVTATTASVKFLVSGGESPTWKMIKGAAYTGCAGGWKVAGTGHSDVHMIARVSKSNFLAAGITYSRSLPLHTQTNDAVADGVGSIVVTGPGLSLYGSPTAPVGAASSVTLVVPPPVAVPAVPQSWLGIQGQLNTVGSFYGNGESIQSCQDLALQGVAAPVAPLTIPCYDETAVAPGAVFTWTAYDTAVPPAVIYAYPYQVNAVPLSLAFVKANEKDLFAQNITSTPSGIAALNTAIAGIAVGAPIDNIVTLNYTQSPVYGAQTNHCNLGFNDSTGFNILQAEQNASATATQQTSCTFKTSGLNSGSLAKPAVTMFPGYMGVGNMVLGNQAGSLQTY